MSFQPTNHHFLLSAIVPDQKHLEGLEVFIYSLEKAAYEQGKKDASTFIEEWCTCGRPHQEYCAYPFAPKQDK